MEPALRNGIPAAASAVLDELNTHIGPVYLVGGVVRNCFHNRPLGNDLHVLAPHPLDECRRRLQLAQFTKVMVGRNQNTLLVSLKRKENPKTIEITTFRYRSHHPPTVEEDLFHRDITLNAMAYRWPDGPLLDPFRGREDLAANRIRLVNGAATLEEDPLRALRFFRFTLQLHGHPDPEHLELCAATAAQDADAETLREELDQILTLPLADTASRQILLTFFRAHLGTQLLPEVASLSQVNSGDETPWHQTILTLLELPLPPESADVPLLDLRWAALLHQTGKASALQQIAGQDAPSHGEETLRIATAVMERFNLSKRRQRRILAIIHHADLGLNPTDRALRRLHDHHIPLDGLFRLLRAKRMAQLASHATLAQRQQVDDEFQRVMHRCQTLRQAQKLPSAHDLSLSGGEILELVRSRPGPWLGRIQSRLLGWIAEDPSRNRKELLIQQIRQWITYQDFPE